MSNSDEQFEQLIKQFDEALQQQLGNPDEATEQILAEAEQKYEETNRSLGVFNALVIGKTGVGKSTLLNAVFKENYARTGSGRPITLYTERYFARGCPLSIYDTRGLELPSEGDSGTIVELKQDIARLIENKRLENRERIEVIWYCVNTLSRRLESLEEEWLTELSREGIPIILVLTQFFDNSQDKKFLNDLKSMELPVETIVGVMAEDYPVGDNFSFLARGLDNLVERTAYALGGNDRVRQLFVQQQLADIDFKEQEALRKVTRYAPLAAAAATIPVSGADSVALWGVLSSMIAEISSIFGIAPSSEFVGTAVNVSLSAGSSAIAATVVSDLLRLFPGIGTLVGTGVAYIAYPVVTGSIGTAYAKGLKAYLSRRISHEPVSPEEEAELTRHFTVAFTGAYSNYLESCSI